MVMPCKSAQSVIVMSFSAKAALKCAFLFGTGFAILGPVLGEVMDTQHEIRGTVYGVARNPSRANIAFMEKSFGAPLFLTRLNQLFEDSELVRGAFAYARCTNKARVPNDLSNVLYRIPPFDSPGDDEPYPRDRIVYYRSDDGGVLLPSGAYGCSQKAERG
jgi:hypothetical protein